MDGEDVVKTHTYDNMDETELEAELARLEDCMVFCWIDIIFEMVFNMSCILQIYMFKKIISPNPLQEMESALEAPLQPRPVAAPLRCSNHSSGDPDQSNKLLGDMAVEALSLTISITITRSSIILWGSGSRRNCFLT